jgi:SWIM zinc finger
MEVALAYDHRTTLATTLGAAALDFAANLFRRPVSFRGRVQEPLLLRQLLLALHESIMSDLRWMNEDEWLKTLDPVITVHPDQLFFEAFSNDQSSYVRLSAPLATFEREGEVRYGTTNIDFNGELRDALQSLRSSRRTVFRVGASGFGVTTALGAGTLDHFERKVDVPDSWVKGFLQVQGALAMRPFAFDVRPEDLLTAIAFFQDNKPPSLPHGLRFELQPDAPISIVLEPWEQRFTLHGTRYMGYERSVRLWGRRRLELLQSVLPYAQRVTIGVLGRGLPHIYVCHCGPYQFALVLSGWTKSDWSRDAAFDLLAPRARPDGQSVERVHAFLGEHLTARAEDISANTGMTPREVGQALFELCRAGRAIVDPITRHYRLRELFGGALDVDALFAPDPRLATAQRLFGSHHVTLRDVTPPDQNFEHPRETRAVTTVDDDATYEVTVAVDDSGRLRFGRCGCQFFQDNLLSRGPCAHIMAARLALDDATATAAQPQ